MDVTTDDNLSRRVAALIDPDTGKITASRLGDLAGLSAQSVYNTRDGKPQKQETLDALRAAVDKVESGATVGPPRREARSARIPMGRGVYVVVEDGADPAALARILRIDEEGRDERP